MPGRSERWGVWGAISGPPISLEPVLGVRRRRPAGGRHQIALAEAAPAERREVVVLRLPVQDYVREDVADERRMLEAVSAPAEVGVESLVLRNRAEHRVMVGRRVVEPGVAAHRQAV